MIALENMEIDIRDREYGLLGRPIDSVFLQQGSHLKSGSAHLKSPDMLT
jgi:hypothetical protein